MVDISPRFRRTGFCSSPTACKSAKRLLGDEALGAGSDQRHHVVPVLDQEPAQLARLVGGDAAGDPEEHARHTEIMPPAAKTAGAAVRRCYAV